MTARNPAPKPSSSPPEFPRRSTCYTVPHRHNDSGLKGRKSCKNIYAVSEAGKYDTESGRNITVTACNFRLRFPSSHWTVKPEDNRERWTTQGRSCWGQHPPLVVCSQDSKFSPRDGSRMAWRGMTTSGTLWLNGNLSDRIELIQQYSYEKKYII